MAYVVKKPLNIGGRRRPIGEILRDDEVQGGSVIRAGYVAKIDSALVDLMEASGGSAEGVSSQGKINLPVISKDGSTAISVAPESICEAVRIMQFAQGEAIEAVGQSEDADMLTIMNLCESNKTILGAVRKKIAELEAAKAVEPEAEDEGSDGDA